MTWMTENLQRLPINRPKHLRLLENIRSHFFFLQAESIQSLQTAKVVSLPHADAFRCRWCPTQPRHPGRPTCPLEGSASAQFAPPAATPQYRHAEGTAGGSGAARQVTGSSPCTRRRREGPRASDEGGVCVGNLSGPEPKPPSLPADWTQREGELLPHQPSQPPQLRLASR